MDCQLPYIIVDGVQFHSVSGKVDSVSMDSVLEGSVPVVSIQQLVRWTGWPGGRLYLLMNDGSGSGLHVQ